MPACYISEDIGRQTEQRREKGQVQQVQDAALSVDDGEDSVPSVYVYILLNSMCPRFR